MLNNILIISEEVYRWSLDKKSKPNGVMIYDNYRALHNLCKSIEIAANHYLDLEFDNPILTETKSFKTPIDKWRTIINEDFKIMWDSVGKFVISLYPYKYTNRFFGCKLDGVFLPHHFHARFLGTYLRIDEDLILQGFIKTLDSAEFKKFSLNLSRYEKRLKFKNELLHDLENFNKQKDVLRNFIIENYDISELLI